MSEENQQIEEVVEDTVVQNNEATSTEAPKEEISYKEIKKDGTIKLDLGKLKEFQNQKTDKDAVQEQSTNDSDAVVGESENSPSSEKVDKEIRNAEKEEEEEEIVLQEISEEEAQEAVQTEAQVANTVFTEKTETEPQRVLPENIESLVKFMEDTGGSI